MDTLMFEGRRYTAVEVEKPGTCGNCAFKDGFGCRLAATTGDALQTCSAKRRADGRSISWVLSCLVENANREAQRG